MTHVGKCPHIPKKSEFTMIRAILLISGNQPWLWSFGEDLAMCLISEVPMSLG